MWGCLNVDYLGCGMFGIWKVWDVGCFEFGMFGMWDVGNAECLKCGMLVIWDVWNVGCGMSDLCWDLRYWLRKCRFRKYCIPEKYKKFIEFLQ